MAFAAPLANALTESMLQICSALWSVLCRDWSVLCRGWLVCLTQPTIYRASSLSKYISLLRTLHTLSGAPNRHRAHYSVSSAARFTNFFPPGLLGFFCACGGSASVTVSAKPPCELLGACSGSLWRRGLFAICPTSPPSWHMGTSCQGMRSCSSVNLDLERQPPPHPAPSCLASTPIVSRASCATFFVHLKT